MVIGMVRQNYPLFYILPITVTVYYLWERRGVAETGLFAASFVWQIYVIYSYILK